MAKRALLLVLVLLLLNVTVTSTVIDDETANAVGNSNATTSQPTVNQPIDVKSPAT